MDEILKKSRIIVCAGSGGVGKTTCSAALALRAGDLGLRVLVLTVDPARRLATTLGIPEDSDEEIRVPGQSDSTHVFAAVINSRKTFDDFIRKSASSNAVAERLLRNPLYVALSTTLSGSQEFTSLERLSQAVNSQKYDLVILDTPPTQHALDFLTAPQKIHDLFQDSITRWFVGSSGNGSWITKLISQGTRQALSSLEKLTGASFVRDLIDFFESMRGFQKTLRERTEGVQALLNHPTTRFVLITSFDQAKLAEALFFKQRLTDHGYRLAAVIINRAFPDWLNDRTSAQEISDAGYQKLLKFYNELKEYFAEKIQMYDKFQKTAHDEVMIFKIPEFNEDVSGLEDLRNVYRSLRR